VRAESMKRHWVAVHALEPNTDERLETMIDPSHTYIDGLIRMYVRRQLGF
jgi:predicted DNA-binding protein (MmcQ/YjbR family)